LFTSRKAVIAAATLILFGVVVGSALATLPSGFTATLLARAHKAGALNAKAGGVTVKKVGGTADVATLLVNFDPGGSSGWHHHPGVGLISVASGAVTVYEADCSHHTYTAGQAFVEKGKAPRLVRNNGTTPAQSYATFVIPADTPATGLRIDDAQPAGCSVH
jgi:quercetin dioxygenase-like cupin family protein